MSLELVSGQEIVQPIGPARPVDLMRPIGPARPVTANGKKLVAKRLGRTLTTITCKICLIIGPQKTAEILRNVANALEAGARKKDAQTMNGRVVDMGWGWAAVAPGVPIGVGVGLGVIIVGVLAAAVRGIWRAIAGQEKKA